MKKSIFLIVSSLLFNIKPSCQASLNYSNLTDSNGLQKRVIFDDFNFLKKYQKENVYYYTYLDKGGIGQIDIIGTTVESADTVCIYKKKISFPKK